MNLRLRCFVLHHGLSLPVEPHLHSNPTISVIRMMRGYAFSSSRMAEGPFSILAIMVLSPLRSCDLELSTKTHFLADFSLDRESLSPARTSGEAQKTLCTSLMSSSVPACLIRNLERVVPDFALIYRMAFDG